MYFLLISISIVFDVTLALVRYFLVQNILKQSRLQGDIRVRRHAAVDAVCGCGKRVRESGRGGLLSWEVGCAERGCRGTLGCLRVVGRHSVNKDASSDDLEKNELGGQIVEKLLSSSVEGEGIVTSLEMAIFARCAGTRLKRRAIEDRALETQSDSQIAG
jgi:hypothetical protein